MVGAKQVMGLAAGENKGDRIAERVDQGMDFRAQSSSGSPDGLVFADFFFAPALC